MKFKFNKYIELGFFLFALVGLVARIWVLDESRIWVHALLFTFQFVGTNILWIFYYNLDYQLNKYLPFKTNTIKRVAVQLILGFGFVKIIFIPFALILIDNFFQIYSIAPPFNHLNKLNIVTFFFLSFTISTLISLGFIAFHFFEFWKENENRAANLEKEKSQVQFDNLKNQLNPHFLFNSLTSLDSLIQENPDLARKFLQQLSKVFRYVLQSKEKGLVSVQTELDFIKNYIQLLQTRFGESLKVNIDIKPDDLDKQIAPVTLQILIENAIKHNVISQSNVLNISILTYDDFLFVENNVQPKKQVETSNRQGLNNLKTLYEFLHPTPIEVIEELNIFKVKIPLV
ncbi:MAG: sensor histidine kinase [Spirosomataceae bacterium]